MPHGQDLKQKTPVEIAVIIRTLRLELAGELVVSGKCRRKNDSRVITHLLGKRPTRANPTSSPSDAIGSNQRNPRIPERLDTRSKSELRCSVHRAVPPRVHAKLFHKVKGCGAAGKANDFFPAVHRLKRSLTFFVFDQPHHALLKEAVLDRYRNLTNAVFAP